MSTSARTAIGAAGGRGRAEHRPCRTSGWSGCARRYGDVVAVDRLDLEVAGGEFFTMLGPSGSGKTTTLRMIAGFERPDAGTVELGGRGRHAACRRTTATSTPSSRTTPCSRT